MSHKATDLADRVLFDMLVRRRDDRLRAVLALHGAQPAIDKFHERFRAASTPLARRAAAIDLAVAALYAGELVTRVNRLDQP